MLTGDKLETATCIAKSSKLVSRTQDIYTFKKVTGRTEAHLELNNLRRKQDNALIIAGDSLQVFLLKVLLYQYYNFTFICANFISANIWARPWENVSYAIFEQQRRRSASASAQSDQCLCCSLIRLYKICRFFSQNFKTLASFCGCTDRFVSGLVGNSRRHVLSCRGSFQFDPSLIQHSEKYTYLYSHRHRTICSAVLDSYVSPFRVGRHIVFARVVCPSVCLSQIMSAL